MRRLASLGFALALVAAVLPAAAPARAQAGAGTADPAATAPDPGVVAPYPYDPKLARLNPGECKRLARQIVHFTDVAARASDRGDALWEQSTVAHVDRLEARWNTSCAREDDTFARMFTAALRMAGRLALKYFTMGYFD